MHKSTTGEKFWEDRKEQIIYDYEVLNKSASAIGKELGCWGTTILYKLREWDVPIKHKRINAKRIIDLDYFKEIDNEHKAYWYGFLFADGHVNKKFVMIGLQKGDKKTLVDFLHDIHSDYPIRNDKNGNPVITITSIDFAKHLLDKGFNHRKSYGADFQKIISYVPDNLIHHFIRGMFDGDGSIKIYKYPYLKKPQYRLGYTGLYEVCEFINKQFHITRKIVKESDITYTTVTNDPPLINQIFDFLYKDATIYMERKYETFKLIHAMTFNDYNSDTQLSIG